MTELLLRYIDRFFVGRLNWPFGWFAPQKQSLLGDRFRDRLPARVIVAQLGDCRQAVLSLPLLHALRECGVKVAFVTFEKPAEIIEASGLADEIWQIDRSLKGAVSSVWRAIRFARSFRPDAFLDLTLDMNFTAALAHFSLSPMKVGFISPSRARNRIYTHLVSHSGDRHLIECYLKFAVLMGITPPQFARLPALPPLRVSGVLHARRAGRRAVVLSLGSHEHDLRREWPLSYWQSLAAELLKERDIDLVLTGLDSAQAHELAVHLGESHRIFNLAGKTSTFQLLQLLSDADLVVSVEGATAHLAAWVGSKILVLMGPDVPLSMSPRSSNTKVLWAALPCSPCTASNACRDHLCMKRISPGQVLLACRLALFSPTVAVATLTAQAPTPARESAISA
jgi:ADP-heptose:LPS heptosyltransferase